MAWDPALLRKYNTTGHFRLLNQVRAELKEQPIQRPLVTTRSAASAGSGGSRRGSGRSGSNSSAGGSGATGSKAVGTQSIPTHAVTRRRGGSSSTADSLSSSAHEDQQPIMAVPVLTDVVMPDSHTGA